MLLGLSFSERFCRDFQRGEVTPTDSPAHFPEDPSILPIDSAIEPVMLPSRATAETNADR